MYVSLSHSLSGHEVAIGYYYLPIALQYDDRRLNGLETGKYTWEVISPSSYTSGWEREHM